jgi:hypothetical protein
VDRQTRHLPEPATGPLPDQPPARRPRRGWRLLAGVLFVILLVVVGARLTWSWLNPLGEQTIDRSGPVLLQSIQNLSRYEAATGNFQVIVDLEKDANFLPDAIKGTRTLFVGVGSVDAYVDFSGLSKDAITVSPDGKTVTIRLPHAQLETWTTSGRTSTPSSGACSTACRISCPPRRRTSRSSTCWPSGRSGTRRRPAT